MFKALFEWLQATCDTDPTAFIVMGIMCSIGAYFTRDKMTNPNGAFLIYPLLLVCAILANWVFAQFGFFDMKKMADWVVAVTVASTTGMIAGLSSFIFVNKSINGLLDRNL